MSIKTALVLPLREIVDAVFYPTYMKCLRPLELEKGPFSQDLAYIKIQELVYDLVVSLVIGGGNNWVREYQYGDKSSPDEPEELCEKVAKYFGVDREQFEAVVIGTFTLQRVDEIISEFRGESDRWALVNIVAPERTKRAPYLQQELFVVNNGDVRIKLWEESESDRKETIPF